MGILSEIQSAVLDSSSEIGPILLKLRLLAARLGSQPLADWVRHESEGYPAEVEVPSYRVLPVSYTGTFFGPLGSGISNAPIAPFLIEKFASKRWTHYEMRSSIAAVDDLLSGSNDAGVFTIEASNLMLMLQGKVYPEYACNAVNGAIARGSVAAIRHAVLSRILELTLELERSVPEASDVLVGKASELPVNSAHVTTQIAQQIIYGNVTTVSAGTGSNVVVNVVEGDLSTLAAFLTHAGISKADAEELARLAASEEPESVAEPMGPKVREWLGRNLKKAASGAWKVGLAVGTDLIKEALLKYYGLK
ncbi:hypothetical protein [Xanthomonas sp. NCPPB 1128]|uniref:AbiTii domain-containing protein n=1 Tax=Xanthomonas sp. NCPPB 1128 TaxID=1775876 RepID=UPI000A9ACB15|nr:hypothetical protein [Xanthomonas sp. NCPPB 1128]